MANPSCFLISNFVQKLQGSSQIDRFTSNTASSVTGTAAMRTLDARFDEIRNGFACLEGAVSLLTISIIKCFDYQCIIVFQFNAVVAKLVGTAGVANSDKTYHDSSNGYCKGTVIDAAATTPAAFITTVGSIPRITLTNIAVDN